MNTLDQCRRELHAFGSPEKAKALAQFFKTGPGQYSEGDKFIGVTMPQQRQIANHYNSLDLTDLGKLLASEVHEERSIALIILVNQYEQGDETTKQAIYDFYLEYLPRINNWDLVDNSAEFIIGPWLEHRDKTILARMANSNNLWERRIAMVSTFHYIKQGSPAEALKIAEILVHDKEDLIQKAVGWMLREIGKRCATQTEEEFLKKHYKTMPRTTLRYAIERLTPECRERYLAGKV